MLAHAARNVVGCAARLLGWTDEQVCRQVGIPLLPDSSIKRALDIDWNDARERAEAITTQPPLKEQMETLVQIRTQDLEPDASRPV